MRAASIGRWPCALRALGANPLIRRGDRLEGLAILLATLVILAAMPVAASIGLGIYADRAQSVSEQMRTRHAIEATAVTASPFPSRFAPHRSVQARWVDRFTDRTELVPVDRVVKVGEQVTVWTDSDGTVVSPPETLSDARAYAAALAVAIWLAVVVVLAACVASLRAVLNRRRLSSWEREWELLINNDDGWANRRG